jgi:putative ABC transport system permease protein
MPRISGLRRVVRLPVSGASADEAAIDAELRFHIDCRVDELTASGTPLVDARRIAEHEFGDWRRYRGDVLTIDRRFARETRMRHLTESVLDDLHHAARLLRAQPGFALAAILTIALGIGATTSVFGVVRGTLLRPLPFAGADRIVHVGERTADKPGRGGTTSYDNFNDWRRLARSFQAIGLYNTWQSVLTGRGDPERVPIAGVSAGIFDVFHVTPFLGRAFVPADNLDRAAAVAVVSYEFWRTRLGGEPAAVGGTILLNLTPVRVVGVLPRGFAGPGDLARPVWLNFSDDTDGRGGRSKNVYALLRPGVSLDQARAEMDGIGAQLAREYPKENSGMSVVVDRLADLVVGDLRRPLYMLLGASLLVLLIACANVSNLLLARGVARGRELAVRAALGAARSRLVRQLLTESSLLAAIGAALGVAIAALATKGLLGLGPAVFAQRPPSLDAAVLAVAIALSIATTLLFGLVPALRSAPAEPQNTLRATSGRATGGQSARTRTVLAVAQLSFAVVLLAASGMVFKSFARVLAIEPGIRGDHLLTLSLNLPRARYDSSRSTVFYSEVEHRLAAMPGVRAVAVTSLVPFGGDFDRIGISDIAGEPARQGKDMPEADRYIVSPGYFATMGIRLVRGRLFDGNDRYDAPLVCLVDEVFAKRIWGTVDPIGKRMKLPARSEYATVVGVVTHVKTYGLDVDSPGQIYMSNAQYPWRWMSMVVRTIGAPDALVLTVRRVVHDVDPDEPLSDVSTMEGLMEALLRDRRFTLSLLGAFAAAAITLALIGLYGVIAYGVSQRRREFGVRIALGARSSDIARMVVAEGAWIGVIGAAIGSVGALATGRAIASLLFEVSPHDLGILGAVAAGLVSVAMLACVVPARRATTVDVAEVLRAD